MVPKVDDFFRRYIEINVDGICKKYERQSVEFTTEGGRKVAVVRYVLKEESRYQSE